MPPVNEQLQISSNHFAKSLVILWALVKESDGATHATEDLIWGTHVLTKQVTSLFYVSGVASVCDVKGSQGHAGATHRGQRRDAAGCQGGVGSVVQLGTLRYEYSRFVRTGCWVSDRTILPGV